MTYELAKQLKDAGWGGIFFNTIDKEYQGLPTLSELIEACGDGWKFQLTRAIEGWHCKMRGCEGNGQSPEEAVAKLWLALNSK